VSFNESQTKSRKSIYDSLAGVSVVGLIGPLGTLMTILCIVRPNLSIRFASISNMVVRISVRLKSTHNKENTTFFGSGEHIENANKAIRLTSDEFPLVILY